MKKAIALLLTACMVMAMGVVSGIHMRPDPAATSPYVQGKI